jgi:hypothetical protein
MTASEALAPPNSASASLARRHRSIANELLIWALFGFALAFFLILAFSVLEARNSQVGQEHGLRK